MSVIRKKMMNEVIEKAEKRYRNRISDYLGSDDYKIVELEIQINESVDTFEASEFTGLELEPCVNPEEVTLKIVMIKKENV